MIRTLWVYLVGGFWTAFYASWVVVLSYLARDKLPCHCDRIPRKWSLKVLRAAGVRVTVEGLENLYRDRPQIVVSNHQSWFDIFTLAAHLPVRYRFVAKKELGRIPVFGRAWQECGHVPVDRGNREAAIAALDQAWKEVHEEHLTMIMFPEGTRSWDGRLQRFKKGAFVLAAEAQVPLVPMAIVGSREVMAKGKWRIRPGSIHVRIGTPIQTEGLTVRDRDRLMREAWQAIHDLMEGGTPVEADGA